MPSLLKINTGWKVTMLLVISTIYYYIEIAMIVGGKL